MQRPQRKPLGSLHLTGVSAGFITKLPSMKQNYIAGLLLWAFYFALAGTAFAQGNSPAPDSLKSVAMSASADSLLFGSTSELAFTLTTNLRVLLKDRGDKPVTHVASLSYVDAHNRPASLPLTLKVRGNFRRSRVNCPFPPLLIDLPKKKAKKTLFAHQNKLKLVTHCQVDEWVVREYLVYKLYNLLTDLSFRAQLARVTYADSVGKVAPETHWAFLLEDDDDLAKRNNAKISNMKQISMSYTDSLRMATVAVFEYMIGNTDWSVPYLHNIRFLDNGKASFIPVPYDFDHAGIVGTTYARPDQRLEIRSVRERVYRGLAYPMPIFQQVFNTFNQVKPHVYAIYENENRLDKAYVKRTLKYLDEFYSLINKPTSAQAVFGANGQSAEVK